MSEVIVRMKLPSSCAECPVCDYEGADCLLANDRNTLPHNGTRPSWCPIVGVLPEHHGRLGDLDAMVKDLEYDCELDARGLDDMTIVGHEREHLQFDKYCKQNCILYLTEQETIVQAERKDDEE